MFTKSNMVIHSRMHSGIRPFACDRCPKSYTQKTNLISHQNSAHNNKRSFMCLICKRNFFQQGHLSSHIKNHVKRNEVPPGASAGVTPLGVVAPDDEPIRYSMGDYPAAPRVFYDPSPYHSLYQFPNYNYDACAYAGFGATGPTRPEPCHYAMSNGNWNQLSQLPPMPQEMAYPAYDDLQDSQVAMHQPDLYVATFEPENESNSAIVGDFLTTSTPLYAYCDYSPPEELRPPLRLPLSRLLHKTPSARLQVRFEFADLLTS